MTSDNEDLAGNGSPPPPGFDVDAPGGNKRREPGFGRFDDRDLDEFEEYDEPDRDTGFASGFSADDVAEEEEFDDLFTGHDNTGPSGSETGSTRSGATAAPEEIPDEEPEDWPGDDEYYEEETDDDAQWPLRMIAVAVVAVLLLVAGVYGVLQERAATQEELRELRATLATSADQADLRSSRDALRKLQQSYDALTAEAEALSQENRELRETIAGLEAQLPAPTSSPPPSSAAAGDASSAAPPPATPSVAPSAGNTKAAPESAASPPGRWFVNFGSYTSRALAESWATRLHPAGGEVIVAPGSKDGRTYYRVRVVGLSDKKAADLVARQLESQLQVSRLWVGQE
jgi:cell division septation protein DedD